MGQPWAFLTSKILQSCRVFTVRNERYRSPRTGQEHDFFLIDSPDWVNVIPLTGDGKVVLVKQFRFGTKDFSLEIPGGMLDDGDTPAGAAARELLEETGFAGDEPEFLGSVHPNPALQTNRCYTYLVRNAAFQKSPEQDSTEDVEVEIVPLKDIPKLIQEGVITHALVIAAFYWYFSKTGFERR
ncbi:MAG: NUDIX hydrolase [Deltaproteobacteria bacterium]|nr:NUDIX hydrolase [Deltaproteobacteria bacterium]